MFIAINCSNRLAWNSPFINSEDTINLEFGMSKNEVLDTMPEPPLYVESGNSETSVWVYNVRTIKVRSTVMADGSTRPNKKSSKTKHDSKIDDLFLTFNGSDELIAWGAKPYKPKEEPKEKPKEEPKTSFKIEGDGKFTIEGGK